MKKSVDLSSDREDIWKCCECETEYLNTKEEINEIDYDFGDEIVVVLVCNSCVTKLDPEKLIEIR